MIRMAFRFDDPSRTSDHALETQILAAFREAGLELTAAVVPFDCDADARPRPLTGDAVPHLKAAHGEGLLKIALHGHCHKCVATLADGNSTEFAGVAPAEQQALLAAGKTCLETVFETDIRGFVPPWNSYDAATLSALQTLGFTHLSADWALVTDKPLPFSVLPHTCNLPHLRDAVYEARRFHRAEPLLLVILHHFDFRESGHTGAPLDRHRLAELLAWTRSQEDIRVTSMEALAGETGPAECALNLRVARWRKRRHWRLQRLLPRYSFLHARPAEFFATVASSALRRTGTPA